MIPSKALAEHLEHQASLGFEIQQIMEYGLKRHSHTSTCHSLIYCATIELYEFRCLISEAGALLLTRPRTVALKPAAVDIV